MDKRVHIAKDADFIEYMDRVAVPRMTACCTQENLEREPGHVIYTVFYDATQMARMITEQEGIEQTEEPQADAVQSGEDFRVKGVVVVSHGFTETVEKFYEPIYDFLCAGYHVVALEHCGHGHSYRLVENDLSLVHVDSYDRYVSDLRFVTQAAAQRWPGLPLILYAHSMGGGVGAALASEDPDLFAKVVLTSPMIKPLTAGIPWSLTRAIDSIACAFGKKTDYVIGHKPFVPGAEKFETSASSSRARFTYYQNKRETNPLYQMNAVSYSWLREAIRLNGYLMKEGIRRITAPLLLMQSEEDSFVSLDEQVRFIRLLQEVRHDTTSVRLVQVPGTRHEIYNSREDVQEFYWKEIFGFLEDGMDE